MQLQSDYFNAFGGSCSNVACLPSKNIIHSAKVAFYFRRSKEFGALATVSKRAPLRE
jgi:pyruvate/2-oxoglutarate dehydrogenase complex dihydrolipoamide dehydrogenase (E3) component